MKRALLFAAVLLLSSPALADDSAGKSLLLGGPASDLVADAEIRKIYAKFTEAWNRHDPKAMASFFMIDGDNMEPDGRHARGQEEVARLFGEEHQSAFKESTLNLTIDSIWFIDAHLGLVDGTYQLSGVKDQEGKDVPLRKGHLTSVLVKEGKEWKLAASRSFIPVPLIWRKQ